MDTWQTEAAWLLKEKYGGRATDAYAQDLQRIKSGEPLGYVIGNVPFLDATIYLDTHPLIPRSETEYWVSQVLNRHAPQKVHRILDLCAGSGCIGVSALMHFGEATATFAEIDEDHHETIAKNVRENGIDPKRTSIVGGNLFEYVSGSFDLILTNPPYIDRSLDRMDFSVSRYEPAQALDGGVGGTEHIMRVITAAPMYLTKHGVLAIEHEPEQAQQIAEAARAAGLHAETHADQYGVSRFTICTRL